MTTLQVNGMSCNNCARHVTEAIQGVPGVRSATVQLEAGRASVRWNADAPQNIPAVIAAVKKAGYAAKEILADVSGGGEIRHPGWQINLWLGVAVTAALMIGEWVFDLAMTPWFQWLSFALAGVVQIFAGAQFYRGAWSQLKVGSSNMDTLVALGSTTAFGYSAWALVERRGRTSLFHGSRRHHHAHQRRPLAGSPREHAGGGALKSLLQLAPQTARKPRGRRTVRSRPAILSDLSSESDVRRPRKLKSRFPN